MAALKDQSIEAQIKNLIASDKIHVVDQDNKVVLDKQVKQIVLSSGSVSDEEVEEASPDFKGRKIVRTSD